VVVALAAAARLAVEWVAALLAVAMLVAH